MRTLTYNEVFACNNILQQIPLELDGKEMPADATVDILLLQTAFKRKISEFESFMEDVLKSLKKEGFDERYMKVQQAREVLRRQEEYAKWDGAGDKPVSPTEAEIADANKDLENAEAVDAEYKELDKAYIEARMKKAQESTTIEKGYLTRQVFASIVSFVGLRGTVKMNIVGTDKPAVDLEKSAFLSVISELLVEA